MPALLVALAGLLVGELLRRRLVTGGYRLDDDLGAPPRALGPLVPVLIAASWWLVAARVAEPAGWVFIVEPTAKEKRFCKKVGLEIIDADIFEFIGAAVPA